MKKKKKGRFSSYDLVVPYIDRIIDKLLQSSTSSNYGLLQYIISVYDANVSPDSMQKIQTKLAARKRVLEDNKVKNERIQKKLDAEAPGLKYCGKINELYNFSITKLYYIPYNSDSDRINHNTLNFELIKFTGMTLDEFKSNTIGRRFDHTRGALRLLNQIETIYNEIDKLDYREDWKIKKKNELNERHHATILGYSQHLSRSDVYGGNTVLQNKIAAHLNQLNGTEDIAIQKNIIEQINKDIHESSNECEELKDIKKKILLNENVSSYPLEYSAEEVTMIEQFFQGI